MGSPRRFIGSGDVDIVDDIVLPPRFAVEVTFRCHQQRHLMRPDAEATQLLLGSFGRAYYHHPTLNLHVIQALSNHGCFVASPDSSHVLSDFMRDFLADFARRLNRHRDRTGTVFERRYRAIPIADEEAMDDRLGYVLTQGTKENLVGSAREWPGVQSTRALLGGPPLVGKWLDRTATSALVRQRERKLKRASARGETIHLKKAPKVWREYPIPLVPMAHWRELKPGQRRARVADMLQHDTQRTQERHDREGTRPMGMPAILTTDPFSRPANPAKSPAPFCHAATEPVRKAFRKIYEVFLDLLAEAREKSKASMDRIAVPKDGTLGPMRHPSPSSPRRPEPPLIIGDDAMYLASAPAIGPPARA